MIRDKVPLKQRRVEVGKATIYYQEVGAGEPVVLVHGLTGSTKWWERNVTTFSQHFHVYLIDLIGFGASRSTQPFVLDEAAASLTRWMDLLGISSANIIGHSMGGYIAADLAADFPERVDRLVLVSGAALPFQRTYLQHGLGLIREFFILPLSFWPVLIRDSLRAGPLSIWGAARQIARADISHKLSQIEVPTLAVWGTRDAVVPLEMGARLGKHLPNVEITRIEGAGHVPMWERPQEFNNAVLSFLS